MAPNITTTGAGLRRQKYHCEGHEGWWEGNDMIWEGVVKFAGSMGERFATMGVATNGNKGWVVRWFPKEDNNPRWFLRWLM